MPVWVVPEDRLLRREGVRDAESLHYRAGPEAGPATFAADPEGSVELMTFSVIDEGSVDGVALHGGSAGEDAAFVWVRALAGEATVCGDALPVELVVQTPEDCVAFGADRTAVAAEEEGVRAVGRTQMTFSGWGVLQDAFRLERIGDGECRLEVNLHDRQDEPVLIDVFEWEWPADETAEQAD